MFRASVRDIPEIIICEIEDTQWRNTGNQLSSPKRMNIKKIFVTCSRAYIFIIQAAFRKTYGNLYERIVFLKKKPNIDFKCRFPTPTSPTLSVKPRGLLFEPQFTFRLRYCSYITLPVYIFGVIECAEKLRFFPGLNWWKGTWDFPVVITRGIFLAFLWLNRHIPVTITA